jgi:hypothetical protein
MANRALDSYVALFVDDSQLKKSFQELSGVAARSGASIGERFAAAFKQGSMIGGATGTRLAAPIMPALPELGGEGGGPSPGAASLARLAQVISRGVTPALSRLNPALAEFVQTGAGAARSAGSFGVVLGGAAIAGTVLSAVIGKYVGQAKEATEVTFEISQSLKNLDAGRAEAQFTKAAEGVDRLRLSWDQINGSVKAGWWEKMIAGVDIFVERFTDASAGRFDTVLRAAAANISTFDQITKPRAMAGRDVFNAGLLEREAQLNLRNAKSVEELNAAYDQSVKSINDRTEAEIVQIQTQYKAEAAAGKVGAFALANIEIDKKRAAQRADRADKEAERTRGLIALEEQQRAHAVRMGRMTMADELAADRAATVDPRRTLQEQMDAESKAFQSKRTMAESYFTFQTQLTGKSNFKEQIEVQRGFMGELVAGSAAWFAQTSKVADLFTRMREEAKAIFGSQAGIAESRASFEGKTTISANDIPDLLRRQREQDERALRGDQVRIGDISGAVGRVDLFRKMDQDNLSPREAFSRMMEDPSKQLAREIGTTAPVLNDLAEAAAQATQALRGLAGTSPQGGQPGSGMVRRPPGGPSLSEENRQAIMDAIATRLTDEKLAVYGRR